MNRLLSEDIMKKQLMKIFIFSSSALSFLHWGIAHSAEILTNSNFDSPDISVNFETLNSAPAGFGWEIVSDGRSFIYSTTGIMGVDLVNTFWVGIGGTTNPDGHDQSLDIDGASSISQEFDTILGGSYLIEFYYSHHYGRSSSTAYLDISGSSNLYSETLMHDLPNSASNMEWSLFSTVIIADSNATTITIQGEAANGGTGFAVDNFNVSNAIASLKPEIRIINGYINFSVTNGGSPDDADCVSSKDHGRAVFDEVNNLFFLCTSTGWRSK